jgi:muramoyltetrapeptide carboxypeptidase
MSNRLFPENIKKIAVAPLASNADPHLLSEALNFIESQGVSVLYPSGRLTNADEKAEYLERVFKDKTVDLIIAERGGYGTSEVCAVLDWRKIINYPKFLLGYSDITFLHLAMLKFNCGTPVSGPVAVELKEISQNSISSFSLYNSLKQIGENANAGDNNFNKLQNNLDESLRIIKSGEVFAPLIPANLTVLTTMIGTPYMPDLRGTVLLLEDISEPLYKIRRSLNHLKQSGILSKISGLIFGNFKQCGNLNELESLFRMFGEKINGPVLSNFRFGHCSFSLSIKTGDSFLIDTNALQLKM